LVRNILWLLSSIIIALVLYLIDYTIFILFLFWLGVPLSGVIQSLWIYQHLERNLAPAIFIVSSRILAALLIYYEIKSKDDIFLVPIILSSVYMLSSCFIFAYGSKVLGLKLIKIKYRKLTDSLKDSWHVFAGNLSVYMYRDINIILMGLYSTSPALLSSYSMAEKLIKFIQALVRPFNRFEYPRLIKLLNNNEENNYFSIIKKRTYYQIILIITLFLLAIPFIYIFEKFLITKLSLVFSEEVIIYFLIMLPSIFFGISNFLFGVVGLNYSGYQYYLFKSIFTTGIFNIIFCSLLFNTLGVTGGAIAFTSSEILLFILIYIKYREFKC
jgi:PST family polysaccharide transporter